MKNNIKKIFANIICIFVPEKKNRRRIRNKILGKNKKNKQLVGIVYKNRRKKEYSNIILELFKKYSYRGDLDNMAYLSGVNAAPGVTEQSITKLNEYLKSNKNLENKLLSVGCGMKSQLNYLSGAGFDVYGVDIDVKNETEHLKYHNLNEYNNLPFDEGEFDFVLAQEIIEHLENPWLLIRKIKRVLKKDGILILTTPNNSCNLSKNIFCNSDLGYSNWFNEIDLWQHINPLQVFEILHILNYNNLELLEITGNEEFYYDYGKLNEHDKFKCTIENNEVLHFICKNLDNKIKEYNPESTYENTKEIQC